MSSQPVNPPPAYSQYSAWTDWQQLQANQPNAAALIDFHSRHKYLLLAHSPEHYRLMGKLLADLRPACLGDSIRHYEPLLQAALEARTSRRSHTNALEHIAGYFKRVLSAAEKAELRSSIEHYRQGMLPLEAPIGLLRKHLQRYPDSYLAQQVYLQPSANAMASQ